MAKSKISWTDYTWNPITGCTKVSDGCKHCYAERLSKRLAGRGGYPKENPFAVTLHADKLGEPLKWREPRKIFVCSMGDLFHEDVKEGWIDEVFQVMKEAKQHTFLILTKRVRRMWDYFYNIDGDEPALENVWLGTSVENQKTADLRIPILLQIPAAKRFISCEPLLGPVDLSGYLADLYILGERPELTIIESSLDWVIVGGESGPGARRMRADWVREIYYQCKAANASFYFKQWGEWIPSRQIDDELAKKIDWKWTSQFESEGDEEIYWQVGKHLAGRKFDGVIWNEFPGGGNIIRESGVK